MKSDDIMDFVKKIAKESGMIEVVRCKDCIWYLKDGSCARYFKQFESYDYCSYGERGEQDDE